MTTTITDVLGRPVVLLLHHTSDSTAADAWRAALEGLGVVLHNEGSRQETPSVPTFLLLTPSAYIADSIYNAAQRAYTRRQLYVIAQAPLLLGGCFGLTVIMGNMCAHPDHRRSAPFYPLNGRFLATHENDFPAAVAQVIAALSNKDH